jgi:hypothetical protein
MMFILCTKKNPSLQKKVNSLCEGVSKILQLFLHGDGQSKGFIANDQNQEQNFVMC